EGGAPRAARIHRRRARDVPFIAHVYVTQRVEIGAGEREILDTELEVAPHEWLARRDAATPHHGVSEQDARAVLLLEEVSHPAEHRAESIDGDLLDAILGLRACERVNVRALRPTEHR